MVTQLQDNPCGLSIKYRIQNIPGCWTAAWRQGIATSHDDGRHEPGVINPVRVLGRYSPGQSAYQIKRGVPI
jgi:hypothetical protein